MRKERVCCENKRINKERVCCKNKRINKEREEKKDFVVKIRGYIKKEEKRKIL